MGKKRALILTEGFEITVLSDGDSLTQVEITIEHDHRSVPLAIGRGEARRRPGDPRDRALGEYVALERAFKSAAQTVRMELDARGYYDDLTEGSGKV